MWKAILIISILLATISIYVNVKLYEYNIFCSSAKIINYVQNNLCTNGSTLKSPMATSFQLNPPLCEILCDSKLDIQCQLYHLSKPSVFIVNQTGRFNPSPIVVKQIGIHEELSKEAESFLDEDQLPDKPEDFEKMILSYMNMTMGQFTSNLTTVRYVLQKLGKENSLSDYKIFWKTLKDHEYLYSLLFENLRVFPRLYGTCEDFYAVEFAHLIWTDRECSDRRTYIKYLETMVQSLQYVDKLSNIWHEPFELCDVKIEHFGKTQDGHIVFLDLDSVETLSSLRSIMELEPECQSDGDCSYFDCHGKCLPNGQCKPQRVNTNVQVVCEKIFAVSSQMFPFVSGSLSYCESSPFFQEIIALCSKNRNVNKLIHSILKEIRNLS